MSSRKSELESLFAPVDDLQNPASRTELALNARQEATIEKLVFESQRRLAELYDQRDNSNPQEWFEESRKLVLEVHQRVFNLLTEEQRSIWMSPYESPTEPEPDPT